MRKLLWVIVLSCVVCSLSTVLNAQASASNKLAWDQAAATLAEAQAFTYKYYPDAVQTGTTLTNVTCTGATSPFQCEVAYPAFTPGSHTLTLTASNVGGESPKSSPLSFTFVVIPAAPTNLRIK